MQPVVFIRGLVPVPLPECRLKGFSGTCSGSGSTRITLKIGLPVCHNDEPGRTSCNSESGFFLDFWYNGSRNSGKEVLKMTQDQARENLEDGNVLYGFLAFIVKYGFFKIRPSRLGDTKDGSVFKDNTVRFPGGQVFCVYNI